MAGLKTGGRSSGGVNSRRRPLTLTGRALVCRMAPMTKAASHGDEKSGETSGNKPGPKSRPKDVKDPKTEGNVRRSRPEKRPRG